MPLAGLMSAPTTIPSPGVGFEIRFSTSPSSIFPSSSSASARREKSFSKSPTHHRFLRAYIEALAILRTDKKPRLKRWASFSRPITVKSSKSIYDDYGSAYQRVPLMTKQEVQAVLEVVKSPRGVQAKPEVFYDNSFVQKIEASGFINSLYAR